MSVATRMQMERIYAESRKRKADPALAAIDAENERKNKEAAEKRFVEHQARVREIFSSIAGPEKMAEVVIAASSSNNPVVQGIYEQIQNEAWVSEKQIAVLRRLVK